MRVAIRVGHHENVKEYTLDADYMNFAIVKLSVLLI